MVKGMRLITLARPALSSLRALAGVQGIKACPFWFRTYTNMVALSPPCGSKMPLASVENGFLQHPHLQLSLTLNGYRELHLTGAPSVVS